MKNAKGLWSRAAPILNKYRYALLVLLVGAALLLLPGKKETTESAPVVVQVPPPQTVDTAEQLQKDLAALISKMDGAGRTEVLLTLDYSAEQVFQSDVRTTSDESGTSREQVTVLYQSEGAEKLPVVQKTRYPVYKGAVVVCQGAQSAAVRLQIVEAVSSLTGLGSDKITVIKMKGQ